MFKQRRLSSFKKEIQEHEDYLFGITLFFEGICILYKEQPNVIEQNRISTENVQRRFQEAIEQARQLLNDAESDPPKIKLIERFQFPLTSGNRALDGVTQRAKILVGVYNDLFPARPRDIRRTEAESLRIMEAASDRL